MVVIGIDPHPKTHTAVALDDTGRELAHLTVTNTAAGLEQLRTWAAGYAERIWAIEGANNPFATSFTHTLAAQEHVVDIAPSLTSQYRRRRGRKKNDLVDAANVARAYLANRELPAFKPQADVEELKELSRIRGRLAETLKAHRQARQRLTEGTASYQAVTEVINCLKAQVKRLESAMRELVKSRCPQLLSLPGIDVVNAAVILAEAGRIERFRNQHAFASYVGAAPIERSSGGQQRRQLNTGGNRRLKRTCHLIAMVRLRIDETTQAFVHRKQREGKTMRSALRALKTVIARESYRCLRDSPLPRSATLGSCS